MLGTTYAQPTRTTLLPDVEDFILKFKANYLEEPTAASTSHQSSTNANNTTTTTTTTTTNTVTERVQCTE